MRVAILDDYQNVSLSLADWSGLNPTVFTKVCTARELADFEVIVAMRERTAFTKEFISQLTSLKLLVTTGKRNAAIDMKAAAEREILVCGTEMLPTPAAELTWALLLAIARHIPQEDRNMREGRWQTTVGITLKGKTLGVVGVGKLGAQVAEVGRAFGMKTIAWSPNLDPARAKSAGVEFATKENLFRRSDFVTIHMVLSSTTRNIVGVTELDWMKPSAILVNTSRGPLVDEKALIEALEQRKIAGAALDVFDEEPLPPSHRLRQIPNTVLAPHLGYVTEENLRQCYEQAVDAIRGYLAGKPVRVLGNNAQERKFE